jgi:long-chain-fatty-acid--[acyl-carrier-protein] ligase
MISMPMIEKILLKRYGEDDRLVLAVEGDDSDGNAVIALFTVKDIDIEEANNELKANGVSGLARIHRVIRIDEIPLLGSGKTDYKILKKMVKEGAE